MKSCDQESRVMESLQSSNRGASVRNHLESCPDCALLARMYREFHSPQDVESAASLLPSYRGVIVDLEWKRRAAANQNLRRKDAWLRWSVVLGFIFLCASIMKGMGLTPSLQEIAWHPWAVPLILGGVVGLLEWYHSVTSINEGRTS